MGIEAENILETGTYTLGIRYYVPPPYSGALSVDGCRLSVHLSVLYLFLPCLAQSREWKGEGS